MADDSRDSPPLPPGVSAHSFMSQTHLMVPPPPPPLDGPGKTVPSANIAAAVQALASQGVSSSSPVP